MKKYSYLVFAFSLLCLAAIMPGCKKSDSLLIPGESAHFTNQKSGAYFVTGATVSYKIPVGLTTISAANRTVNISVSSPTGAVEGTHYTLSTKSVVIPAGKEPDALAD